MTRPLDIPNLDDLIARYEAGEPVKRLADESGISRPALKKRLLNAGVTVRGRGSESVVLTLTPTDAARLQDARVRGGISRRGTALSDNGKAAMAAGRAKSTRWITPEERLVREWLVERGETSAVAQVAVGTYNIDIGLPGDIAVEVQRADTVAHSKRRVIALQRLERLREAGWHVIYVLWLPALTPVTTTVAEQVVADAKLLRGNPSARRQYRVIWGDGKYISRGDHDLDELARIWPTAGTNRHRTAKPN